MRDVKADSRVRVIKYRTVDSPVGALLLAGDANAVKFLLFTRPSTRSRSLPSTSLRQPRALVEGLRASGLANPTWEKDRSGRSGLLAEAEGQLVSYFAGKLREFAVPVAPDGTEFQRGVWQQLQQIPYGETVSYGEIARRMSKPLAVRAVGLANGSNPISIIIPCHRVIGSNGTLTGYGGGLGTKRALLELERGQRALL